MSEALENRSIVAGALGIEFSECSIAAADLSAKAVEIIESKPKVGEFYVLDGSDKHQRLYYNYLTSKDTGDLESISLNGYPARLVLARPRPTFKEAEPPTDSKKFLPRFRRQQIEAPIPAQPESSPPASDPILAAVVGTDTLLPLASFARRGGGNCSYVQLGQEMGDDAFYVTAADEQMDRHSLIEALRVIFRYRVENEADEYYRALPNKRPSDALVQEFINTQSAIHEKELALSYERQLVDVAQDRIKTNADKKSLTVLYEGQDPTRDIFDIHTIVPPRLLANGHVAELVVAKPERDETRSSQVEILAITRSEVAIPIARMNSDVNRVDFMADVPQKDHNGLITGLLFAILGRPAREEFVAGSSTGKFSIADLLYFRNERLIDFSGTFQPQPLRYKDFVEYEGYFARPTSEMPHPLHKDNSNDYVEKLREYFDINNYAEGESLLNQLGVGAIIEQKLGIARRCDQMLMRQIGKLAAGREALSSVFEDMQMGTTSGDALIAAEAIPEGAAYRVKLSGRPVSMPDEPMKGLVEFWVNPTKENLGLSGPKSEPEFVDEIAKTILEIREDHQV